MNQEQNKYKHNSSFADKLRAGWTKEALMKFYCIDEKKYARVLASLKNRDVYHVVW